jgi:hypothetical protein
VTEPDDDPIGNSSAGRSARVAPAKYLAMIGKPAKLGRAASRPLAVKFLDAFVVAG